MLISGHGEVTQPEFVMGDETPRKIHVSLFGSLYGGALSTWFSWDHTKTRISALERFPGSLKGQLCMLLELCTESSRPAEHCR